MLQPLSEYLEKVMRLKAGWYWLGCYGTIGTESLWNQKRFQRGLEAWYVAHADAKAKGMGKIVTDCTGVFKYPLWVQPDGSVPYQPIPDTDMETTGIFNYAKAKGVKWGAITTIPRERKGILVTYTGHMGCYLGDGTVLEARGGSWGVVETQLDGRGWQYWYENPFVDYTQKGDSMKKGDPISEQIMAWQTFLISQGATDQNGEVLDPDGEWGGKTEAATVKFMAANGFSYPGYIDFGVLYSCIDAGIAKAAALNADNDLKDYVIQDRDNQIKSLIAKDLTSADHIEKLTAENGKLTGTIETLTNENARLEADNVKLSNKIDEQATKISELTMGTEAHDAQQNGTDFPN